MNTSRDDDDINVQQRSFVIPSSPNNAAHGSKQLNQSYLNISQISAVKEDESERSDTTEIQRQDEDIDDHFIGQNQELSEEQRMKRIKCVFALLFTSYFVCRFDHGIIPALNTTLKDEFGFTNIEMGSLGSAVFMGNVAGSLIGMPMFNYCPTKIVLVCCLLLQITALFMFTILSNFYLLGICRFLTGMAQVQLAISLPIWVDHFGPKQSRSLWMTALAGGVGLGMIMGYSTAAFIATYTNWRWAFYDQIMLLTPEIIGLMFVSQDMIDLRQETLQKKSQDPQQQQEQQNNQASQQQQAQEIANKGGMTPWEMVRLKRLNDQEKEFQGLDFWQQIGYILGTANFTLIMFGMTSLFIIVSGIQFWITDYMVQVINLTQAEAFKTYGLVGLVGPIGGIIATGLIFDKIGGYTSKNALPVCCVIIFVAFLCGALSVSTDTKVGVGTYICIELFSGAFCLPVLSGILITQVPLSSRTLSNSIANFSFNLFGYLPAPFLYGIVYEARGGEDSRWGLAAIQSFGFVLLCSVVLAYFRQRVFFMKEMAKISRSDDYFQLDLNDKYVVQELVESYHDRRDSFDTHESLIAVHRYDFNSAVNKSFDAGLNTSGFQPLSKLNKTIGGSYV